MKRPSFQFYPGDWLHDTALSSCSIGARGLWIAMLCYMHQGNPYGYLKVGRKVILPYNLAVMVGATLDAVEGYLRELHESDVFSIDEDGCIFSRRMIRDEEIRARRAAGGIKGGNPALMSGSKDNWKVNLPPNHEVNQKVDDEVKINPTPSSSSSSSSSSSFINIPNGIRQNPPDSNEELQRKNGKLSIPIKQIFELYKQKCPELTQHRILTKSMESSIKQRTIWLMKDKKFVENNDIIQWFDMFFSAVNTNDFLCGRTPIAEGSGRTKPFVADLQWLMKEDNFNKFLSGKYNNDK